jgi:lysophospholipase L1-like esterase
MVGMTIPLRDLFDRAVPALASVVPLESWVLSDAKYRARLAVLRASVRRHATFDLVMIGDSHTQYVEGHRLFSGIDVLNLGIARDTTVGVEGRLGMIPDGVTSRYLLVEIGYNDLKYRGIAAIAENLGRIVAAIGTRRPGKILVQGPFPVEANRRFTNSKIRDLNGRLQALCNSMGCQYIDVTSAFSGRDGGLDARYSGDGVHLNENGNCKWIQLLMTYLK